MSFTLQTGEPAPDFRLRATDGKTYALGDFASNPVIGPIRPMGPITKR
jgi:peroxiredoxin